MDDSDADAHADVRNEGSRTLYLAAVQLPSSIQAMKNNMPWPPLAADLHERSAACVPTLLFNFLACVLGSDLDDASNFSLARLPVSETRERYILSIAQDLVHCASEGRILTAKHLALTEARMQMTGSWKLACVLNRPGHASSVDLINELIVAYAEKQLSTPASTPTPSNIQPGPFISVAWDNNDILEETLSGSGTTHCTNGIIVQRQFCGPQLPQVCLPRTHCRRFDLEIEIPPVYNASTRKGPPPFPLDGDDLEACPEQAIRTVCEIKDFAWLLARVSSVGTDEPQVIPGWSGFNALSVDNDSKSMPLSAIGYRPVVGTSPTRVALWPMQIKCSSQMW